MRFFKSNILFSLLGLSLLLFAGCAKEEIDSREKDYGYVQFKLYKEASYEATKAVDVMQYLRDASKVMVMLQYGDKELTQTLVLDASSAEAAEYGLRSEKLLLLAGEYDVKSFTLYDKLDNELYYGGASGSFTVVPGGLQVHDLLAKVVERGKVKLTLVKDFRPVTKAGKDGKEYTFDVISYADVTVKETTTGIETPFTGLKTKFSVHFTDDENDEYGYQTSSSVCDTLLSLEAGKYAVSYYALYNEDKILLEERRGDIKSEGYEFEVADNRISEGKVPVVLTEADEYIKDYYALKTIWEALGGPKITDEDGNVIQRGWYYQGDEWPVGSNWDFTRDVDLWGNQPGVKLHDNGRVALLSLSGFGFEGDMPAALGQFTQMVELYLGNHNETNTIENDPTVKSGMGASNRMERHKEYLRRTHIPTQFSEPIARGLKEHNASIPEIALYDTMQEDEIIERGTGRMRIKPMDDALPGALSNKLRSLPEEIGNLTNLETFFVANSTITELPAAMENLASVTDIEVYNCPLMKNFPTVLAKMPGLISLNLSANPQWADADEGLRQLAASEVGKEIQILYMNECSLTLLPKEINNMTKLGLFSVASNKISKIEAAFPDVSFTQLYLDNNLLETIPFALDANGKKKFFRIEDVETFSCTYNRFKLFPDIFDAKADFGITSVDFSYNEIEGFENAESGYQGIYVQTLSLANNPGLKKFPKCISDSESKVDYINMRGCSISEIPKGSFSGKNMKYLVSLDLSYNHLDDLPSEFHAVNMPYFYGIDLSYNRFDHFPFEPFDSAYLTTMALRGQRDENGNRCMREWPQNMFMHTGLRAMYLGSNDIGKVDDELSYLIYILDVADNPNLVLDISGICYYIQQGVFFLMYDKTQDIRGCDVIM